jgi:hypothetical protein
MDLPRQVREGTAAAWSIVVTWEIAEAHPHDLVVRNVETSFRRV